MVLVSELVSLNLRRCWFLGESSMLSTWTEAARWRQWKKTSSSTYLVIHGAQILWQNLWKSAGHLAHFIKCAHNSNDSSGQANFHCSKNANGSQPETYRCMRPVSSVLCVHEPTCDPPDCHGRGECVFGLCHCQGNWVGAACNELQCGVLNCTRHGTCTEGNIHSQKQQRYLRQMLPTDGFSCTIMLHFPDGCECNPGRMDPDCSSTCPLGTFGLNCSGTCLCHNGGTCEPTDGRCICPPGFTGDTCQEGQWCNKKVLSIRVKAGTSHNSVRPPVVTAAHVAKK